MIAERGLSISHTTILRWVQRYVPEFDKRWSRFVNLCIASAKRSSTCLLW